MKKKIVIATSVHPALDDRIFFKEAKSLASEGYEIVLIAQHNKEQILDGIKIIPLPKPKNRLERLTKIIWKSFILAMKEKASIYHFHDPELIPIGIFLKLLLRKKVIYDLHELVYFDIAEKVWLRSKFLKKAVQLIYLFLERLSIVFFDQLILATDHIANHIKRIHGYRYRNNYVVLRNFPILSLIEYAKPADHSKLQKPIILYAGLLSTKRGIKELVQSMEFIGTKAVLWLLGSWESEEFKQECESIEGWKYTEYIGFVPLDKVFDYMKLSSIGISVLHPIKNTINSLPIKAFEYMACSLPMVMSDFPFWREVFGEFTLFANPYEPRDIADKIFYLIDNPDKRKELGLKGRQLVEAKYNWELESKKLIGLYKDLLI